MNPVKGLFYSTIKRVNATQVKMTYNFTLFSRCLCITYFNEKYSYQGYELNFIEIVQLSF